jgi:hypothetical protein
MKVRKSRKRTDHSGSTFDGFVEEEGIREEVEAVAIKRVLAWQLERAFAKTAEVETGYGQTAPHQAVAIGSFTRSSKRFFDTRYDRAGSESAWQTRNHSGGGGEDKKSVSHTPRFS